MVAESVYLNILIADEDSLFRKNLSTQLRLRGHSLNFALGGFHILHLLEQHYYQCDLIVIHNNMHDMPGEEIIALIRLFKDKNDLPILFISKRNTAEDIRNIIALGANDYIVRDQNSNVVHVLERIQKYSNPAKKA